MKIGIIGAGMIGGTLAKRLVDLGHNVVIANSRGPDTIRQLADEAGATPVTGKEAANFGEIVIVTIPQRAVAGLPKDLFSDVPADVVVIDTGNYYPTRDGSIPAIEEGQAESAWVADQLGRPVVKAFNTIYFKNLLEGGVPSGTPGRVALPVSGGPPEARARVMALIDELGFDTVDVGDVEESWRHQPGTPCYATDLDSQQLEEALAAADRTAIPAYRRAADDVLSEFFKAQRANQT